ncbi:MAG TPA: DUF2285 domain-containing protein [Sphingomonas sp.]|nr:DUF2285 domain-containing protein [Sphingomonas sp.]
MAGGEATPGHPPPAADWRDADAYAPLRDADRYFFAWEWLRRDPAYVAAAAGGTGDPARFGLACFEPPGAAVPVARPIWLRSIWPGVFRCRLRGGRAALADWRHLPWARAEVWSAGCVHCLLSDGLGAVRFDVLQGRYPSQDSDLLFEINGPPDLPDQLEQLARLQRLLRCEQPRRTRSSRTGRWIATLRVHDALATGARYREIAAILFGERVVGPRWWLETPSWGLRVQRLAAASRTALAAGPGPWLCPAQAGSASDATTSEA